MMIGYATRSLVIAMGLIVSAPASAEATLGERALDGAGLESRVLFGDERESVPLVFRHVGLRHGVPYRILYAVSLAESQTRIEGGRTRPWPWTLNIAGAGRYYATRADAERALVEARRAGTRNIDVGFGQVNLHWNGHLFAHEGEWLDPVMNLEAAAQVLLREFAHCERAVGHADWWCAVGRYHSGGESEAQRGRAARYSERVFALWEKLK